MKCSNCGSKLPERSKYCPSCGSRHNKNICTNCGAELGDGAAICNRCGTPVYAVDISYDNMKSSRISTEDNGNKKALIIGASATVTAVIFAVCVIIGFAYMSGGRTPKPSATPYVTSTPSPAPSPTPLPTPTPAPTSMPVQAPEKSYAENHNAYRVETEHQAPVVSGRSDLYSPYLTYKRMEDIHNSILTDDETFYDVSCVIYDFDEQCAAYINGERAAAPDQLMPGSTAYRQQVSYKKNHPSLKQVYTDVEVINCRASRRYCYVWVKETMQITENGSAKNQTEHWVYKLSRSGGEWYIEDYTRDPAY